MELLNKTLQLIEGLNDSGMKEARERGLKPMLHMNMSLGEGTGAVLGMSLVDAGCRILNEMATFAEANVMDLEEDKILN